MPASDVQTAPAGAIPARPDPYLNSNSLEFRFRERRFGAVRDLIQSSLDEKGEAHILDLGGTEAYWKIGQDFIRQNRGRLHFTIVNTEAQPLGQTDLFTFIEASATETGLFGKRTFDLVHSNSVIEHVGDWRDMGLFAYNTRRLSDRYYVQTPNYWFAYEPHFRFPGFQYLPVAVRISLIRNYALGFFPRIADHDEAVDIINHHRLLSTRNMRKLFPDGRIWHEKFFGLNKSIIAARDKPRR